jgi:phage repressor protein C with HTH and peptisase S24 domain
MIEITQEWLFSETKEFLAKGEKVVMRGRGSSMNPYLRSGKDIAVLSPFREEDLHPGDIVLFSYHGRYILHRIIGQKGGRYLIQGDGVYKNTEIVLLQDIISLVRTVIRPGGREVSVQSFGARLYWQCWRRLRPFRRYLLWILRRLFKRI